MDSFDRRDFLKLAGIGGVVYASGLPGFAGAAQADFSFVQLTDTHWGFKNPAINPEAETTLKRAVAAVNALPRQPDFIVFTGDQTHTTDDPAVRRQRLKEFKEIASGLKVKAVRFLPGEHDAALDKGEAYKEVLGEFRWTMDHKGVHFIALDNCTDAKAWLGADQLDWLRADLAKLDKEQPIVVLTHRPLFDLVPEWDWTTPDGDKALALLAPFKHVSVFYGHIHQEHHVQNGTIAHHAATSLIFPLTAPRSVPKRAQIPWDTAQPFKGLGFRSVAAAAGKPTVALDEIALKA